VLLYAAATWGVNVACMAVRAMQFSLATPLCKGGLGGFRGGCRRQIPPHPPLAKGGMELSHGKLHDPAWQYWKEVKPAGILQNKGGL
jgi:hypothetical protein